MRYPQSGGSRWPDARLSVIIFGVPTRLLAIALIVGLATACTGGSSDDPKPSPTPTRPTTSTATSSSPSPTQTGPLTTGPNVRPGEKPPAYPTLAREHTARGALALAIYYFRAYDWGYATNDGSLVSAVSGKSCEGCRKYLNGLADLRRKHEYLTGGRLAIPRSSIRPNDFKSPRAEYVADVVINEEPIVLHSSATRKTVAPAVRNYHSLLFLKWVTDRWMVVEVTAR